MNYYRNYFFLFVFLPCVLFAQTPVSNKILLSEANLDFVPVTAEFIIRYRQEQFITTGVSIIEQGSKNFIFACIAEFPRDLEAVSFSLLIKAAEGKNKIIPEINWKFAEHPEATQKFSELREKTSRAEKELNVLTSQKLTLEQELKRLRTDAAVIANVGRIVNAQGSLDKNKQEIANLDEQIIAYENLLKLAPLAPSPRSFPLRERVLSEQLTQLRKGVVVSTQAKKTIEEGVTEKESSSAENAAPVEKEVLKVIPPEDSNESKSYWDMDR